MKYKLLIELEAKLDIQEVITWYNEQQKGLGRKFYNELKIYFKYLETVSENNCFNTFCTA